MSLKDSFSSANYRFTTSGTSTLQVDSGSIGYRFDFAMRLLTVRYGESLSTQPFSQLDREMLAELRDKLAEMGGTPPELPAEAPTGPVAPRKLNP